jgi:hypothetical protein
MGAGNATPTSFGKTAGRVIWTTLSAREQYARTVRTRREVDPARTT